MSRSVTDPTSSEAPSRIGGSGGPQPAPPGSRSAAASRPGSGRDSPRAASTARAEFRDLLAALDASREQASGAGRRRTRGSHARDGRADDEPDPSALAAMRSGAGQLPGSLPVTSSGGREPTLAARPELDALFERAVTAMQLGHGSRQERVARMKLSLGAAASGHGHDGSPAGRPVGAGVEVEVELAMDAAGLRASFRADDDRVARAFAQRVQREFDACGLAGTSIEVET